MQENGNDFQDSRSPEIGGRRKTDNVPLDRDPSQAEILRILIDIRDRVTRMENRMGSVDTAFVKDDLGRPDYDGHRIAHRKQIKDAEAIDSYKMDATKKVIGIVIGLLLTFTASGFVHDLIARIGGK